MQVSNFQNQNFFRPELEINSHQPFFWTALISWRHSSAFCVDGLKPADKDETNEMLTSISTNSERLFPANCNMVINAKATLFCIKVTSFTAEEQKMCGAHPPLRSRQKSE